MPDTASVNENLSASSGLPAPPPFVVYIERLPGKRLVSPLSVLVEADGDGFIARFPDIPQLYGYGDDVFESLENLKVELSTLHDDLMAGDDFTEEWLDVKKFLMAKIGTATIEMERDIENNAPLGSDGNSTIPHGNFVELWEARFEKARAELRPLAEKAGITCDEDVFALVS